MGDSINSKLRHAAGELASDFRTVAKQLDDHMKNVNIARVTGGSAGVFGGILAIAGVVLIPFTAGTSGLLAAGVGASIAAAGGLTSGGALIVMDVIKKLSLDPLLKKWDAFSERLNKELKKMDRYAFEKLKDEAKEYVDKAKGHVVESTVRAGNTEIQAARDMSAGAAAGGAAREAGRLVASVSSILDIILIGFSVYDIIDGAIQQQSDTGTRAGDYLKELAQSLDDFSKNGRIEDFLE